MNLLNKVRLKLAGEVPAEKPTSPQQAISALNHLPDDEKERVLDYLKSAIQLTENEPAKQ